MHVTAVLFPSDSGWTVLVPALPGCLSYGDTETAALANVADAARLWLGAEADQGRSPLAETRDVVLAGVREALEIMDEMRAAGELPTDFALGPRLAVVTLPERIHA
jgi:antitoxin HicB